MKYSGAALVQVLLLLDVASAFLQPLPMGLGRKVALGTSGQTGPAMIQSFSRRLSVSRASTIERSPGVETAERKPDEAKAREAFRTWVKTNLYLSVEVADEVFDIGFVTRGPLGKLLILEGPRDANKDRELFFILDGQARVEVRGSRVATLKKGDFIGEASFVSGRRGPRSVTVICAGDDGMDYIVWDQKLLKRYMEKRPPVLQAFNEYFIKQLSSKLLSTMKTYERTAALKEEVEAEELKYGADFGFRSSEKNKLDNVPSDPLSKATPSSAWQLSQWNFRREYAAIRQAVRFNDKTRLRAGEARRYNQADGDSLGIDLEGIFRKAFFGTLSLIDLALEKIRLLPELKPAKTLVVADPKVLELQAKLQQLTLDNEAIAEREVRRREIQGNIVQQGLSSGVSYAAKLKRGETPWFILLPYAALCTMLDEIFKQRPIARFWFLETVARMPYFSYISMLHLYETLGWWSVGADVRKIHFAEEWNEMHHLQIMESLGGDSRWGDRFFARHAAILYYWILNIFFFISPRLAYNFSELIESHAVDTYGQFLDENEALLKSLPAPKIAIEYYCTGDLYLFDEFQTSRSAYSRRPVVRSLYDVFKNIMLDESEHVKTVNACQTQDELIISPNAAAANAGWAEEADEKEVAEDDQRLTEDWLRDFDPFSSGGRFEGGPPDQDEW